MRYKIWDTTSYGAGEELEPFTLLGEFENAIDAYKFYQKMSVENQPQAFVMTDETIDVPLLDGRKFIYESPDNGKTVYRRRFGVGVEKELVKTNNEGKI